MQTEKAMPVDSAEVGGDCDTWPWSYRLLGAPISMQLLVNCSKEGGISGGVFIHG